MFLPAQKNVPQIGRFVERQGIFGLRYQVEATAGIFEDPVDPGFEYPARRSPRLGLAE
jgi:hypothetical protein